VAKPREEPDFTAAVLLTDGVSTKIAVLIIVEGNNVYALQPRKQAQPKISLHATGQWHAKIGRGKAQLVRYELPPASIEGEEQLFSISFENFASLLPYDAQKYDAVEIIDLAAFPADTVPYVEVATGQRFLCGPDIQDSNYIERLVSERIVRNTAPKICIRVKVLEQPGHAPTA
jgi:hypothetical protein